MFLLNEVCLTYKKKAKITNETPIISSPEDAYAIFMKYWEDDLNLLERAKALFLDTKNRVIGITSLSAGGINGTVIDTRILFSTALQALATAVIIAHNHPSGDVKPSDTDKSLTDCLEKCGKLLDIQVVDHLVLSDECFYSFSSQQIIFV